VTLPAIQPRGVIAFCSRTDRAGDWELPSRYRIVSVMGDIRIDLRHARFHPGTSVIEVVSVMGQIRILVPHGVRVECDGGGFLRDFKMRRVSAATPRPDAPCVRIVGSAYCGSVHVRVVDPDK
jgi:Cell wall-active antibiotics response 4TMS YvqF